MQAEVPTARCISFPKAVKVRTLKLPPPKPINTEKHPIKKLMELFKKKFRGMSFAKTIFIFKSILIATMLAIAPKIATNIFPSMELAKIAPKMEPETTPMNHFFMTFASIFFSL